MEEVIFEQDFAIKKIKIFQNEIRSIKNLRDILKITIRIFEWKC